jgi:plastocyanin
MYKKLLVSIVLLALLTMLLAACSIHEASGPTGPVVHMGNADFVQHSITVSKGDSITLIDDVAVAHTIKNGSWAAGKPTEPKESGAPTYSANFTGNDNSTLGPFPTAGTFHYYCTVHPGMNLTVIVK